jgi:uncharacterized protein YxjI
MKTFTVTQKILSFGATYLVTKEGTQEPLYTVKGKILTIAPKLEMAKAGLDAVIKTMKGNLTGTRFTIIDQGGTEEGSIRFPLFSFLARFSLTVGDSTYTAKGGIMARKFVCEDPTGKQILSISKEWDFRDKFVVSFDDSLAEETAILAAVSIDQKYFQNKN